MNIDYSRLRRIAELAELLSDRTVNNDGLSVELKIDNNHIIPSIRVTIKRWEGCTVTPYRMCTDAIGLYAGEAPMSMDEMADTLEVVILSGFRDRARMAS